MDIIEKLDDLIEGKKKKFKIKIDSDIMDQKKGMRIPTPPKGGPMKDKKKYNRKEKHKRGFLSEVMKKRKTSLNSNAEKAKRTVFKKQKGKSGIYDVYLDGKKIGVAFKTSTAMGQRGKYVGKGNWILEVPGEADFRADTKYDMIYNYFAHISD